MTDSRIAALHLPHLRANPFSARPLEVGEARLLAGRTEVLRDLGLHLRFGSPRMMVLQGERGSGRTSILHACANLTGEVHANTLFPESEPVQTLLNELYIRIAGYQIPSTTGTLVEQMVAALAGRSGDLPLITFDFAGVNGEELAHVFERLTPTLSRLRALVVVALTPAQLAAWSEDLQASWDITEPLEDLEVEEVRSLIDARISTVSHEGWAASPDLLADVMARTGGRPSLVVRHLRDLVDEARGASTARARREEIIEALQLDAHDAKQRMAPEPPVLEDLPSEPTSAEPAEDDFDREIPEMEPEPEPAFPEETEEPEPPAQPQHESSPEPALPSLEVEPAEEPDMSRALGGTVLQMEPGTEPPAPSTPTSDRSGAFSGLARRQQRTNRELGLDEALRPTSASGPMAAKPDTSMRLPEAEPTFDSEEAVYWDEDALPEPEPEPEIPTQPLGDVDTARRLGDSLRALAAPTAAPPPLDIARISNLNDGEIAIVEAAAGREISPSDAALQAYLAVGRPRLSQIFNALLKAGILSVRKQGRSRLFRLSPAAQAHLSGGHMEA